MTVRADDREIIERSHSLFVKRGERRQVMYFGIADSNISVDERKVEATSWYFARESTLRVTFSHRLQLCQSQCAFAMPVYYQAPYGTAFKCGDLVRFGRVSAEKLFIKATQLA